MKPTKHLIAAADSIRLFMESNLDNRLRKQSKGR